MLIVSRCTKYCLGNYYHYSGSVMHTPDLRYVTDIQSQNRIWHRVRSTSKLPDFILTSLRCYCGNSVNTVGGATLQQCDLINEMRCPGNTYQYCGGPGFLNLYYSETL